MAKAPGRVSDFDPNSQSCGNYKEPSVSFGQTSQRERGTSKSTPQAGRMTTGSGHRPKGVGSPIKTGKG